MLSINQRRDLVSEKKVKLSCIVPMFNEAESISAFLEQLTQHILTITDHYEIICIDDGSLDTGARLVETAIQNNDSIKLIQFSRQFGKESALMAGLQFSQGDVTLLIDSDFQHPFSTIHSFINKWAEGFDMVYGVRSHRQNETWLKRQTAEIFYRIMAHATDVAIPPHAGDFRLMDRKVVDSIKACDERALFMKGIYAWVGYKSIGIPYDVSDRKKGTSRMRYRDLTELAITGITSFSNIPLRVWSIVGFFISLCSLSYAFFILIKTLIFGVDVPGFATIVIATMFIGGVQLLSVGILGEYIARIFNEVKKRPRYIIDRSIGLKHES